MQGRHPKQAKHASRSAARSIVLQPIPLLILILMAVAILVSAPVMGMDRADLDLEVRVWTGDDTALPTVEREVVRKIQQNPDSAFGHYLLSHAMIRIFSKNPGDLYLLKQATDVAQQSVDLDPRQDFGYVALANVLDIMGSTDRALRLLDEAALAGVEPTWRLYFTRARLSADKLPHEKVLGLLENASAFAETQPRIIASYVIALLQTQHSGKELVEKLESWNKRFPAEIFEMALAATHVDLGNFQKAHEIYQKVIAANPSAKEAMINNGILLYRDLKNPDTSVKLLGSVLAGFDAELQPQTKAMIHAHLGSAWLDNQNIAQASIHYRNALYLEPANLEILDFVTKAFRERKRHKEFAGFIKSIISDIPGTGILHALHGEVLSENLGDHDLALTAFANAITLEPDRSDFYNGMGLAYYRKKTYPEALKLFVAATEVDPNDATARYNEACVLALMGRTQEALNTLAEALTLDPRLSMTALQDSDFSSLRDMARFKTLMTDPVAGTVKEDTDSATSH